MVIVIRFIYWLANRFLNKDEALLLFTNKLEKNESLTSFALDQLTHNYDFIELTILTFLKKVNSRVDDLDAVILLLDEAKATVNILSRITKLKNVLFENVYITEEDADFYATAISKYPYPLKNFTLIKDFL